MWQIPSGFQVEGCMAKLQRGSWARCCTRYSRVDHEFRIGVGSCLDRRVPLVGDADSAQRGSVRPQGRADDHNANQRDSRRVPQCQLYGFAVQPQLGDVVLVRRASVRLSRPSVVNSLSDRPTSNTVACVRQPHVSLAVFLFAQYTARADTAGGPSSPSRPGD